jgi:hypothetical protein
VTVGTGGSPRKYPDTVKGSTDWRLRIEGLKSGQHDGAFGNQRTLRFDGTQKSLLFYQSAIANPKVGRLRFNEDDEQGVER